MNISLKLFGAVAFIMIFTYTATAIIYDDYSYIDSYEDIDSTYMQNDVILTFEQWLNKQYDYAYNIHFGTISSMNYYSNIDYDDDVVSLMLIYVEFNIYNNGYDWFLHSPIIDDIVIQTFPFTIENICNSHYEDYLDSFDVDSDDMGMIDSIMAFLGSIPESFNTFLDIMTFNIPNINGNVRMILNIFMIPLWLIMIIGIAPFVISAIEAIGRVLDAMTPLT